MQIAKNLMDTSDAVANNSSVTVGQYQNVKTTTTTMTTATTTTTTTTMRIDRRQQQRHQVKEFNNVLSCYLCRGYLINATTVDNCIHSYCRSCIVQHLDSHNHCPQCKPHGGKHINLANLKSDETLRSIVYKLVPGLYQQERERMQQFAVMKQQNELAVDDVESNDDNVLLDGDEDYFQPAEPISLSMEYHPKMLTGCRRSQIPSIRYLQCPAGVTIHHLKRFLCSKYEIDPASERVGIEIMYEDEILPEEFNLMDVGYCYNWKRLAPMKFTYRILIHNKIQQWPQIVHSSEIEELTKKPSSLRRDSNDNLPDMKRLKKSDSSSSLGNLSSSQKTVQFIDCQLAKCDSVPMTTPKTEEIIHLQQQQPPPKTIQSISMQTNLNAGIDDFTLKNNISKICSKNEDDKSLINDGKGPVKVIIARKQQNHSGERKKNSVKSATCDDSSNATSTTYHVSNDFKSLRSNDIRYCDYTVTSTTGGSSKNKTLTLTKRKLPNNFESVNCNNNNSIPNNNNNNNINSSTQRNPNNCDIIVSIPQSQVIKSSNSTEEGYENITLAQLKTAAKKPTSLSSSSSSLSAATKTKNVPKLKIELNRIKPKISLSKPKSAVAVAIGEEDIKKVTKHRKFSFEESSPPPTADKIDLETYVKNIGLRPIDVSITTPTPTTTTAAAVIQTQPQPLSATSEPIEKIKFSPNASPRSSESSLTGSSSSNNGNFSFVTSINVGDANDIYSSSSSSSHKKRKKKHSKEPKDSNGKRRKLHAEISSKSADESLKMKVKITGSSSHTHHHRPHKIEARKLSCSSDEVVITSPPCVKVPAPIPDPETTGSMGTKIPRIQIINDQNMSTLNRTLSEESSNITNLMNQTTAETSTKTMPKTVTNAIAIATATNEKKEQADQTNVKNLLSPIVSPLSSTTTMLAEKPEMLNNSTKSMKSSTSPPPLPLSPQIMTTIHNAKLLPSAPVTPTTVFSSSAKQSSALPKTVSSVQDLTLPASPPLPPSLFKTIPLTIPTITTPTATSAPNKLNTKTNSPPNVVAHKEQQSPMRPPLQQPSTAVAINKSAMKQGTNAPKSSNFAIPNPPRSVPNSQKLSSTPSSIASSVNRDAAAAAAAAQLKRSASLDESYSVAAAAVMSKQQRIEQDRLIRKSAYGVFASSTMPTTTAVRSVGYQQNVNDAGNQNINNSNNIKNKNNNNNNKSFAKPFPKLSEKSIAQKNMAVPLTAPSLTKITETFSQRSNHPPPAATLTITSQKASQKFFSPYSHHQQMMNNKPALEIVRIAPNQAVAASDQYLISPKTALTTNSPSKANRPPPPPIPLVKIKKSTNQSLSQNSGTTPPMKMTHSQASPPALISMRSIIPAISSAGKSSVVNPSLSDRHSAETINITNGKVSGGESSSLSSSSFNQSKPRSALRDYRPSSKDGSIEILDLSSTKMLTAQAAPKPMPIPMPMPATSISSCAGNSLEAALNKIKQNISSSTLENASTKAKILTATNTTTATSSEDLQNLHMLSESATNRERISIRMLPKLNEISKIRNTGSTTQHQQSSSSSMVRHQNASVRNIPNPSALAFRNQPTAIPMLTSISKNSPPSLSPPPLPQKNSIPSPPQISSSEMKSSVPSTESPVPKTSGQTLSNVVSTSSSTSTSTSTSTNTTSTSPPRSMKKNMKIDQVAANLNIRAAAAASETAAATAASTSSIQKETVTVSSEKSAEISPTSVASVPSSSAVSSNSITTTKEETSSEKQHQHPQQQSAAKSPILSSSAPKTSFRSISSLVASSSSSSSLSSSLPLPTPTSVTPSTAASPIIMGSV